MECFHLNAVGYLSIISKKNLSLNLIAKTVGDCQIFSFSVLFSLVLAFWNQPPAEVNLSPITIPGGLPNS